jgi:hypothetical protein
MEAPRLPLDASMAFSMCSSILFLMQGLRVISCSASSPPFVVHLLEAIKAVS